MKRIFTAPLLALSLLLPGCGGSGNSSTSSANVVPAAQISPSASASPLLTSPALVSTNALLGRQSYSLPNVSTTTGSMSLNAISIVPANGVLTLNGVGPNPSMQPVLKQSTVTLQSGYKQTIIYSFQLTSTSTIALQGLPGFSLQSPSFAGVSASTLSFQIFDDVGCTNSIAGSTIATSVDGTTATFAPVVEPFTLQPNHTYRFVFYVTVPQAASGKIAYIAEPKNDAVIGGTTSSNQQAAVARTISGSNTELYQPIDVAVAPNGNLYVLNSAKTDGTQSVLVFPLRASGNIAPLQVISNVNKYGPAKFIDIDGSALLYVAFNQPSVSPQYDSPGGYFTVSAIGTINGAVNLPGHLNSFAVAADGRPAYTQADSSSFSNATYFDGKTLNGSGAPVGVDRLKSLVFAGGDFAYSFNGSYVGGAILSPSITGARIAFDDQGDLFTLTISPDNSNRDVFLGTLDNPSVFPPVDGGVPGAQQFDAVFDLTTLTGLRDFSGLAVGAL